MVRNNVGIRARARGVPPSGGSDVDAFELAVVGMAFTDVTGRLQRVNAAFAELLGRPRCELVGARFASLAKPSGGASSRAVIEDLLGAVRETATFDEHFLRPDGTVVAAEISVRALTNPAGRISGFLSQAVDITRRERAETALHDERQGLEEASQAEELQQADELGALADELKTMAQQIAVSYAGVSHRADHDTLTGLFNRQPFIDHLDAVLARPERRAGTQAVLFIDLDDFKHVNDTLGHDAGDRLLQVVGERLREAVRPGDIVARLGGDEFAVLLDGIGDAADAVTVAERTLALLKQPADIAGQSIPVNASIGVAVRRADSTPDSLTHHADIAMYAAKAQGKNRIQTYTE